MEVHYTTMAVHLGTMCAPGKVSLQIPSISPQCLLNSALLYSLIIGLVWVRLQMKYNSMKFWTNSLKPEFPKTDL